MRSLWIIAALLPACGGSEEVSPVEAPVPPVDPEDLAEPDEGKADGWAFAPGDLIDDFLFEDGDFMSAAEAQAFLEATPYGRKSFLADLTVGGQSVAEALVAAARAHDISPLVLLTKLQVEMGLVSLIAAPSKQRVDFAMGCGCHDGRRCLESYRGLARQLDCSASRFRSYLDDIDHRGSSVAGWGVGISKQALDPQRVTPKNRATAALYTYTPWVLRGRGGNWLFWNVYRKYARHFLAARPNHRWIGADCVIDADCGVPEALCERRRCAVPCERLCPDSRAPETSATFCVEGSCVPRCDVSLFPNNDGCSAVSACERVARHNDPNTFQRACVLPAR